MIKFFKFIFRMCFRSQMSYPQLSHPLMSRPHLHIHTIYILFFLKTTRSANVGSANVNPHLSVRKSRSASVGPQMSGPQMSFRKIQSAIVDPQMSFRKCRVTVDECWGQFITGPITFLWMVQFWWSLYHWIDHKICYKIH